MEILITDKSVFEINNRYPTKHKLHDGAEILIFDDFLKKPDEYRDILDSMPAFNSDLFYKTASPGWRQIIPYEFYFHIEALLGNFTQYEVWVEQAFTNIYTSRMPCKSKAWLPHYDNKNYALNLWLCDGPGGTAFYTWNGVYNITHYNDDLKRKIFQHHEQGDQKAGQYDRLFFVKVTFVERAQYRDHKAGIKAGWRIMTCGVQR